MSYFGPEYFNCKHKNLTVNKLSKGTYTCDKCNKDFVMIPAKHEPFYPQLPNPPRGPFDDPPKTMPYYPGHNRKKDNPRYF